MNKGLRNIFGALSLWIIVISVILLFILSGSMMNMTLFIIELALFSVSSIIFAACSKKRWVVITAIILNIAVLAAAYYLPFAD